MGAWDYKAFGTEEDPIHQSDLGDYSRCARLLRFRRDEKAGQRVIDRRVSGILASGQASHGVLKRALPYAVDGKPVNLTHIRGAFFEEMETACAAERVKRTELAWRKGAKPDDHYRLKIAGLFHFLTLAQQRIASVEAVEMKFRSVIRRKNREIHTEGTWDIVFRTHQGALALADYKTGERRPSTFTMTFGFQLGIYPQGMLEGHVVEDGRRFGRWPDEIWILMVRDFLPQKKDSHRQIWRREEAEFFRARPGETVRIKKGTQRGPGWYRAERSPDALPGLAEAIWSIVAVVRSGQFPKRWDDECDRCPYKRACVQDALATEDMTAAEKRKLEAALADLPLDELGDGLGEDEP